MWEAMFWGGLFWLGFVVGYQGGKNAGYHQGWRDKEFGGPFKPPFK